jgi:phosphatidylglycerophosphatase A
VFPGLSSAAWGIGLAALTAAAGVISTDIVCRSGKYGTDYHDPQAIVIDEFAGYYLCVAAFGGSTQALLLGFLLFRVFDMVKPPPIKILEQLPGAWGIVVDDLAAGVYAAAALWALQCLLQ